MKRLLLFTVAVACVTGCARKAELDAAKSSLVEAQKKIEQLEADRVPRMEYDVTKASLRLADQRIAELEQQLKETQQLLAAEPLGQLQAAQNGSSRVERPKTLSVARGTHETANETLVHSADTQLNFGDQLQISSPTGLLVTDPDLRVVGGDLNIKAKGITMETTDGLLTAEGDGSVKFQGSHLTMKFDDPQAPLPNQNQEKPAQGAETVPAEAVPAPATAQPDAPGVR
jgi:hypothetical protein